MVSSLESQTHVWLQEKKPAPGQGSNVMLSPILHASNVKALCLGIMGDWKGLSGLVRKSHKDILNSVLEEEKIRDAARQSLQAFFKVLRSNGSISDTHDVLLEPYLVTYDMLNDDDFEIRDEAATIASAILPNPSTRGSSMSLIPLAASAELSEWLALPPVRQMAAPDLRAIP
ncbi:MAG: hypothetical protein M1838_001312 [Thelocarpon superellum]|nr:MAG: hypothetical protein M1838_001312 [Thelocarpon superellum]